MSGLRACAEAMSNKPLWPKRSALLVNMATRRLILSILGARSDERKIVANLLVHNGAQAVDFYKRALGAQELYRFTMSDGVLMHAQLRLGDGFLLVTQEYRHTDPEEQAAIDGAIALRAPVNLQGSSVVLEMYVDDVDSACRRAIDAGATVKMPVTDTFYGDRSCQIVDPYGHVWGLASVREVISPEEIGKRAMDHFRPEAS
jgi:PhnB protein